MGVFSCVTVEKNEYLTHIRRAEAAAMRRTFSKRMKRLNPQSPRLINK
jgi:hypothetical protein